MSTEQTTSLCWEQYISSDPRILDGKPAITGTRIGVEFVLENLAGGHSVEELVAEFSHVSKDQLLACVAYALEILREQEFLAPASSR